MVYGRNFENIMRLVKYMEESSEAKARNESKMTGETIDRSSSEKLNKIFDMDHTERDIYLTKANSLLT